jgi:hypothetical protein
VVGSALSECKQQGFIAFLHHLLADMEDRFGCRNSRIISWKANRMADDLERRAA